MNKNQSLGRWGEAEARRYLESKGYAIIAQNVRTPYGEIDIIARLPAASLAAPACLVFVEVKTRASASLGKPEISVNRRKQAHLLASIQYFMQNRPSEAIDWRLDVLAIEGANGSDAPLITHFENAVSDL